MPDRRELLQEGVSYQRGGAYDKALERYRLAAASADAAERAEALRRQASIHRTRCNWDEALDAARASADVARSAGLADLEAEALNAEAAVLLSRGLLAEGRELLLRVASLSSDARILGNAEQNLGTIAATLEDFEAAGRHYHASREHLSRAGDPAGAAVALNNEGRVAILRGDDEQAVSLCKEAVAAARALDDVDLIALATMNYAEAIAARGDAERAESLVSASLGYFSTARNDWRRVECLRVLGELAGRRGDLATADRCFEQGLTLARKIGAPIEVQALETARSRLRTPAQPD